MAPYSRQGHICNPCECLTITIWICRTLGLGQGQGQAQGHILTIQGFGSRGPEAEYYFCYGSG